uniref:Uncharacterized protein n=1 Tax=Anopheles atroparvus TaxID=41427 RepID=A0A182J601_ANOAO
MYLSEQGFEIGNLRTTCNLHQELGEPWRNAENASVAQGGTSDEPEERDEKQHRKMVEQEAGRRVEGSWTPFNDSTCSVRSSLKNVPKMLTARSQTLSSMDIETPPPYDVESLPSYTIVSGLPSYQDAIEQLKQKQMKYYEPIRVHRPSVMKLFESQDLLANAPGLSAGATVPSPNPQKLEEIRYNFVRPLSVHEVSIAIEGTVPTTSSLNNNGIVDAGTQPPSTPPTTSATTPPPPYKSQISTISTTSSTTTVGLLPALTTTAAIDSCGGAPPNALPELSVAIRVPQKKIGVCHYTVENERPAGRS